jgi:hypothetical protein
MDDTTPEWVKELQLKLHGMTDEELLRYRVIADINCMDYQQDEPDVPPPDFWADVWWRTFELWCLRRGRPKPKKSELYDNARTLIHVPSRMLH